jgi:hypothetical protein
MKFVYLVYTECDGLRKICSTESGADYEVFKIAAEEMDIDVAFAPLDFDSPTRRGWDVCYWKKEIVCD